MVMIEEFHLYDVIVYKEWWTLYSIQVFFSIQDNKNHQENLVSVTVLYHMTDGKVEKLKFNQIYRIMKTYP